MESFLEAANKKIEFEIKVWIKSKSEQSFALIDCELIFFLIFLNKKEFNIKNVIFWKCTVNFWSFNINLSSSQK